MLHHASLSHGWVIRACADVFQEQKRRLETVFLPILNALCGVDGSPTILIRDNIMTTLLRPVDIQI